MKVTGETITDEQIRHLLTDRDPTVKPLSLKDRAWCISALRIPVGNLATVSRQEARDCCAAAWNARHGGEP